MDKIYDYVKVFSTDTKCGCATLVDLQVRMNTLIKEMNINEATLWNCWVLYYQLAYPYKELKAFNPSNDIESKKKKELLACCKERMDILKAFIPNNISERGIYNGINKSFRLLLNEYMNNNSISEKIFNLFKMHISLYFHINTKRGDRALKDLVALKGTISALNTPQDAYEYCKMHYQHFIELKII